jgi:hypothetical protein
MEEENNYDDINGAIRRTQIPMNEVFKTRTERTAGTAFTRGERLRLRSERK